MSDDLQHYLTLAADRRDRVLELEAVLEFYANTSNYKRPGPDGFPLASRVESDGGQRARKALNKEDKS